MLFLNYPIFSILFPSQAEFYPFREVIMGDPLKLKASMSRSGVALGTILGLCSSLTLGLSTFIFWKAMERENRAYIQQSIGDTSLLLANQFKNEFEHLASRVIDLGKGALSSQLFQLQAQQKPLSDPVVKSLPVGTVDTDGEIIDLTLWRREPQTAVFGSPADIHPIFLALNTQNKSATSEIIHDIARDEELEKGLIQAAFQGHMMISLPQTSVFSKRHQALIAVPLGRGIVDEIVVAHVELARIQKGLIRSSMVSGMLVDDFGNILADPDSFFVGKQVSQGQAPLLQAMHQSNLFSGQIEYWDEHHARFVGGYAKVGIGQLSVLVSLSQVEATASLVAFQKMSLILIFTCFALFMGLGYLIATHRSNRMRAFLAFFPSDSGVKEADRSLATSSSSEVDPSAKLNELSQIKSVTVIYGSMKYLDYFLIHLSPAELIEALNEFFDTAASVVAEYGGTFERSSGASFSGIWGATTVDQTEIWRALRCALELRKSLHQISHLRRTEGQKPIFYSLGIHTGHGLLAHLGPASRMSATLLGESLNCAKALSQLTRQVKTDLLVSQEVWQRSDGKFVGELLGEARLTESSGLISFFSILGFRDEQGQVHLSEALIELPQELRHLENLPRKLGLDTVIETESLPGAIVKSRPSFRWLVNNGSQILGPLTPEEISSLLFSQELDFDCECWAEGTGESSQLRNAGIFQGSQDQSAQLWVYDGRLVHGPMTIGFLVTAMGHGAILTSFHICMGSTIQGWNLLETQAEALISQVLPKGMHPPEPSSAELSPAEPETSDQSSDESSVTDSTPKNPSEEVESLQKKAA